MLLLLLLLLLLKNAPAPAFPVSSPAPPGPLLPPPQYTSSPSPRPDETGPRASPQHEHGQRKCLHVVFQLRPEVVLQVQVQVQVLVQVQIQVQVQGPNTGVPTSLGDKPPPLAHLLTGIIYQDDFLHQLLGRPVDDGVDLGGQYRAAGREMVETGPSPVIVKNETVSCQCMK